MTIKISERQLTDTFRNTKWRRNFTAFKRRHEHLRLRIETEEETPDVAIKERQCARSF
jgi:hypothetical protein